MEQIHAALQLVNAIWPCSTEHQKHTAENETNITAAKSSVQVSQKQKAAIRKEQFKEMTKIPKCP